MKLKASRVIFCLAASLSIVYPAQAGRLDARRLAIERALAFIYAVATDDVNLSRHGGDLLWCFYSVAHTSRDDQLRESAARVGRRLAQRWRKLHAHVPVNATAHDIYDLVLGAYAADRLGIRDPRFKAELRQAAPRFSARDYLGFDAEREPPHGGDPNRYDTWSSALITTFFGDAYGIRLGASYRDVLQWRPCFPPYEALDESLDFDIFYAVTHVVYTLNQYNERRIAPSLLPEEFVFLRRRLASAVEQDDPEMMGEALDTLKAGGFENDPEVQKGIDYLISSQRADGTWAGDEDDIYTEYHSAWTSIDGLRDYRFRGQITALPRANAASVGCGLIPTAAHIR